jgi:hypothetical protein
VTDLLPLSAPSYEELAAYRRHVDFNDPHAESFGRYRLHARIPAGPGDECFVAIQDGPAGFVRPAFLRRFPAARLREGLTAAVKRRAHVDHPGIEQLYELARHEEHGLIVSQLVEGIGLGELDAALRRRGERVPWPAALAMLHDALVRAVHLRAAGAVHGDLTPSRLRLSFTGCLYLCFGLPTAEPVSWARMLGDVAHPILCLAATEAERALLDELILGDGGDGGSGGDGDALGVASDALVQRHPELDPALPALLLSALRGAPAMGDAAEMILEGRPQHAMHRLWRLVAETLAAGAS